MTDKGRAVRKRFGKHSEVPVHDEHRGRTKKCRRQAKAYLICMSVLFHRKVKTLFFVPSIESREKFLDACHDMAGHWDRWITMQFVRERLRWPGAGRDVNNFCKTCDECQKDFRDEKYNKMLRKHISGLFDTFSPDFARSNRKWQPIHYC